ncbi:AzlC family ABC transporter permease [Clostridium cylindrosporum]|uniref:AzlC family protein n=1 Tax=Clostridium cylindrosporum DSM 605 TaxID=1121307 RepID=A0A0J8D812_CLOCY|nr:AzlC family ABC transporter permease [Clostridium cylindrosporum]KMT22190.1 AzlC family protein [Clostridium cylindrosporum DSM 605]
MKSFSFNIKKNDFINGLKKSLPISLGYFPVSFTFGVMASNLGLSPLIATFISLTNYTSAGQFAGTNLIVTGASFIEIGVTVFLINLRYMLMSFSLSQKIVKVPIVKKLTMAFTITDETYALMALEDKKVSFNHAMGIMIGPFIAWFIGTLCGAISSSFLSSSMQDAMGIALYAMFLAIIIPPARKFRAILVIILIAATISCLFFYLPILNKVSTGFVIIIATVISCAIGAKFLPMEEYING